MILGFALFMVFTPKNVKSETSLYIPANNAEVWELLTDTAYYDDWRPGLVRIDSASGQMGTKGFYLDIIYKPREEEIPMHEKWVDVEPNKKLVWQVVADKVFTETRTIALSDSADGTIVSITRDVNAENWLVKFFRAQLKKALPMESELELHALRKLVGDRASSQL